MAWIERAKPIAYGELRLMPWEFGQLTVREFNEIQAGCLFRETQQLDREATWMAMLLNGMGNLKTPITKEQLLGRPSKGVLKTDSVRDRAEAARRKRIEERRQRARTIDR